MRRYFQTLPIRILLLSAAGGALGSTGLAQEKPVESTAQSPEGERLIPAAIGIRTDKRGNSWNVEPNGTIGRIGSTMVNSGLDLTINDEKFVGFQPMMTADAKEFVLRGRRLDSMPGLQVQRRIRLMEEAGGLRYAEMFYNGSADPVTLNVGLATNFSGNYKTFLTDRGRTEPVVLDSPETGIVVLPGSSQSTKAFLFTLAAPQSERKPTISAQSRYGLNFQYRLDLSPGETAVIVHNVAQVVIPRNFDRRTLLKLFRPVSFSETEKHFDPEWSHRVVNASGIPEGGRQRGLPTGGVETLGVERGTRDVLAIGEETRLVGSAEGGELALLGEYGDASLALEEVAAIVGGMGSPGGEPRMYLRDGQIFTANIEAPGLAFAQAGGGKLDLDIETLDRLVMATGDGESDPLEDFAALIETRRGDRLKIEGGTALEFTGITPWGELPIALDDLIWLGPAAGDSLGHRAELTDGTSCLVLLSSQEARINLDVFGDYTLEANQLKSIFTRKLSDRSHFGENVYLDTVVHLNGKQRVAGKIGDTVLPIVSGGGRIETATNEIRRIERVEEAAVSVGGLPVETPTFRIERWDGGIVTGYLALDVLSMKVRGRTWSIPIQDIERIETSSPSLTAEVLGKIGQLVERLGADDWATREDATRELGAFGYLARTPLQRELSAATDPEVSRRIERVLAELN
ncbi:MAG: hypothetical protein WD342_02575 [Verrucomicrobiales bacterium]